MNFTVKALSTVAVLGLAIAASAAPVVSYTVSGTSGDYTLDFSVTNTLGGTNDIYFFGVLLDSGRDIVGSPAGFGPNVWTSWNNSGFGGSSLNYNNNWIDFSYSYLEPGQTVSGFDVMSTDATAPTSVNWFAYAYEGTYTGGDNFNNSYNPGFEGVATQGTSTPSPAAILPLLSGLVGVAVRRKKA
jgi:hypothetical protein